MTRKEKEERGEGRKGKIREKNKMQNRRGITNTRFIELTFCTESL